MRVYGLLLVMVAGCGFDHGAVLRDGGPTDDATDGSIIDTPPDAFDPLCFGRAPFTICMSSMPTGTKSLDDVDTDGATSCAGGDGTTMMVGANPAAACVIAADAISLASTLVGVSGDKPLVLLAVTTLRINAGSTLDITSGRTAGDGPGANPADCGPATTISGNDNLGGAGGGAGGSFGASGGAGAPGAGGTGGTPMPPASVPVDKLRGGCRGGTGGDGDGDQSGARAPGSSGGGAVYLLTRGELIVDGTVDASGAGGNGGNTSKGGGGGGGSGGMILIHAGSLRVGSSGQLIANGGGGGGGAGNGTDGADGSDPSVIDMAAPGGPPNGGGSSAGGAGGFKSTDAGSATNTGNGGAAGGGSVGVIRVLSGQPIPANNVSPTPQLN